MDTKPHRYIAVSYELYVDNGNNTGEKLIEEAPADQPFQFVTGLGVALDAFEALLSPLATDEKFEFTLPKADAYGDYDPGHVVDLDKQMFCIDGRFDKDNIFVGNMVPLENSEGQRFFGKVVEVQENKVVMDLNHPLAGKALHFKGQVVESRPATEDEIKGTRARMSGEHHCGCCEHDDASGHCHDDEHCCHGHCHHNH